MRTASFETAGRRTYGVLSDDTMFEANAGFRERYPDLRAVLGAGALDELRQSCDPDPCGALRFLPTIPNPDKLICIGINYRRHVEEMGRDMPEFPMLFVRFPGSVTGHLEPLVRPSVSDNFDFEGELAVVIGRRARAVRREDALGCVAGYTCFMDGSVRDWQRHTSQVTAGKNFAGSGAMGPCLVTPDELPPPPELALETRVNGSPMQSARLSDLIFDIPALLEYITTFAELEPGDVIATGTPGGVGVARKPPVWLKPEDSVEVDLGPVGCLRNPVRAE